MSNKFLASIKNAAIKALGGEVPQESKANRSTKIEYVERPTSLSAPVADNKEADKVDAVDYYFGKFTDTLSETSLEDSDFKETYLADIKTATQEAVNLKLQVKAQAKARQREINLTKDIKAADRHLDKLSYGIVCKQEEHAKLLAETEAVRKVNKQVLDAKRNQPLDVRARAARQKAALEARKAQAKAVANQGSKQPEATQSKKSEQRQDPKPPVNNGPSNPMEDEVNPEVTVSAAPSTRDVSPLNNNAGKTQEVLPTVDGKI